MDTPGQSFLFQFLIADSFIKINLFANLLLLPSRQLSVDNYDPAYRKFGSALARHGGADAEQYCRATSCKGLAQGSYVAVGVGFEPATLRTQYTDLTTEPTHPTGSHNDTTMPATASVT